MLMLRSNASIKLAMGRLQLVMEPRREGGQPGIIVARTIRIGDAPVAGLDDPGRVRMTA